MRREICEIWIFQNTVKHLVPKTCSKTAFNSGKCSNYKLILRSSLCRAKSIFEARILHYSPWEHSLPINSFKTEWKELCMKSNNEIWWIQVVWQAILGRRWQVESYYKIKSRPGGGGRGGYREMTFKVEILGNLKPFWKCLYWH